MESVDLSKAEKDDAPKKDPKERILLEDQTKEIITRHMENIRNRLGEFVDLNSRQVVNFLIQKRSGELTPAELEQIRDQYADRLKIYQGILDKAKLARKEGQNFDFLQEIKNLETLGVMAKVPSKRGRKRKNADQTSPDALPSEITSGSQLGSPLDGLQFSSNIPISNRKKSKKSIDDTSEFALEK